jgi:iron complex outermembrane receptor protein
MKTATHRALALFAATSAAAILSTTAQTAAAADEAQPRRAGSPESPPAEKSHTIEEIVVTGTLLRGVAPIGSNVITVDRAQIVATGAVDTNQMLAKLPQVGNFFNDFKTAGGGIGGGNARNAIVRPNLRNLPGGNTTTGPQTLILVDGHRVVGAGIGLLAVDAEIVPPGLIDHVEVITDGGSAVYGSDAIGGVINLITRRNFTGLRLVGRAGFADGYQQQDFGATAGKNWNSGSAYLGYNYSHHSALSGGERDWIKRIDWATGIPTGRYCGVANVTRTAGTRATYKATDLTTPGISSCDDTDNTNVVPETRRHNVLAGFNQDLTSTVKLDVRAIYAYRRDDSAIGPLFSGQTGANGAPLTITSTNPYYRQIPGAPAGESQQVTFNYGPVLGNASNTNQTTLESWNITPNLTWDIGDGWQARAMVNYGESHTQYANNAINTTLETAAIRGTTLATAINPYDIAATQNLDLIRDIGTSFVDRGSGRDKLTNLRFIVDGSPFALPGGEVHMALGAEYTRNNYSMRTTNTTTRTLTPYSSYAQSVTSFFGEVAVPIFGDANAVSGIHKLDLSGSLRYDKYNDFGDTTNGKIGVNYQPVEWIALRANWGQSFNAPTPPDALNATNPTIQILPFAFAPAGFVAPAAPPANVSVVVTSGSVANLKPQTAETWSVGGNVRPPLVPGLAIDLSYYRIKLHDLINSPIQAAGNGNFFAAFPELYKVYPNITAQDLADLFALNPNTGTALAASLAGRRVIAIGDLRTRNIGDASLSGIDFDLSYKHPMRFGSFDARLSGNYQISQKIKASPLFPAVDALAKDASVFRAMASVGATAGNLRAQATLNHTAGYDAAPSTTLYQQTHVKDFNTVDLYFSYQFTPKGNWSAPSINLGIYNAFDKAPPVYQSSGSLDFGYRNGFSIGRTIQIGVIETF